MNDLDDLTTAPLDEDRRARDTGSVQRSGATIVFWILIAFLMCLGICVLLSVLLALVKGS